jgi:type VI secretion system secreted protein VgrG
VVNGSSRCRAFRPAVYFKLKGHFRKDTNQDYFLTSVVHDSFDSTYRQNQEKSHYYKNTFTAIPKTVPYRPPRDTPRPTVHGLQPAAVVGKAGEEIWVDKYGRVKVQFFWDRVGKKNENSSCWIRVSQIWAGKNWGWMTIPRIGQEVLVDFLEGDPDRPIIVGRVYNAEQMPPWDLPANQTQSGILTRSSKGGTSDNANYMQFEDKTGSEQINVWAQKDMNTTVENNDTQHVMVDRTINVDGKHTETIVKDTTITITQGNHSTTVSQGNQSITVSQGNQTTEINMGNQSTTLDMGNITVTCSAGSISMTAMKSITLTVCDSSISITPTGVTISAPMISLSAEGMATVTADGVLTLSGSMTMINS